MGVGGGLQDAMSVSNVAEGWDRMAASIRSHLEDQ
jgi:hypothetical protein